MDSTDDRLTPIGRVQSSLTSRDEAPRQPHEGAPPAEIVLDEAVAAGLDGIQVGDQLVVLTWLHQATRDVLQVHPRNDPEARIRGVFTTRSPDRPNPIGLHRVTVTAIHDRGFTVDALEAIDGTPVLDCKSADTC